MTDPNVILDLIKRFEDNAAAYKSGHYNETQLRLEFVNPFFKCLGWDMDNVQGYAEAYKDDESKNAIMVTVACHPAIGVPTPTGRFPHQV